MRQDWKTPVKSNSTEVFGAAHLCVRHLLRSVGWGRQELVEVAQVVSLECAAGLAQLHSGQNHVIASLVQRSEEHTS